MCQQLLGETHIRLLRDKIQAPPDVMWLWTISVHGTFAEYGKVQDLGLTAQGEASKQPLMRAGRPHAQHRLPALLSNAMSAL